MGRITNQGILAGCDEIVDNFFGVAEEGRPCRYGTKKTCRNLKGPKRDAAQLLDELYTQIETNWAGRRREKPPANKNWHWKDRSKYAASRITKPCDEVRLERDIVRSMGGANAGWVNAVPTSSGMTDSNHDKLRNIDLVHSPDQEKEFTFFELKTKANTPLYAAIEILYRGILNVFTRLRLEEMKRGGYVCADKRERMLRGAKIQLCVLAPCYYYQAFGVNLSWLGDWLNQGLRAWLGSLRAKAPPVHCVPEMDFVFKAFPPYFSVPKANGEAIRGAMGDLHLAYKPTCAD